MEFSVSAPVFLFLNLFIYRSNHKHLTHNSNYKTTKYCSHSFNVEL